MRDSIVVLGIESSIAYVREPEGNGCIERFFRTLEEQLLWVPDFAALDELAGALEEFRQRYNDHWLLERLTFQSPRQARREAACPRGRCMTKIKMLYGKSGAVHSITPRQRATSDPGFVPHKGRIGVRQSWAEAARAPQPI